VYCSHAYHGEAETIHRGVSHPGYELISLWPAGKPSEPTYAATSCLLPFQVGIYLHWYIPLLLFTLVVLAVPRIQRYLRRRANPHRRGSTKSAIGLPIHHTRTPSFLDYGNRDSSAMLSDPEEDDDDLGGYVASPGDTSQYSYHHGATDDDLPTSAVDPQPRSPRKTRRPSIGRVRRVSRVWCAVTDRLWWVHVD
jgi:hypothetical protein